MQPFLDWTDVWPGLAGRDEEGRSWVADPPQGLDLRLQCPHLSPVFFRGERPWEGSLNQCQILCDGGRYRMWYWAFPPESKQGLSCYAESDDGCEWTRPELGQYEFQGSKANNILCDRDHFTIHSVFVDPRSPADERYKAIGADVRYFRDGALITGSKQSAREVRELRKAMELEGHPLERIDAAAEVRHVVRGAVSADGLNWRVLDEPLIDTGKTMLDTQSIAAFDEESGEYVAFLRGQAKRRRCVRRTGGPAFGGWSPTRHVLVPDPQDGPHRDIYTSAYCRSPGSRRHLMFPSYFDRLSATLDIYLATSWDGWNWTRPERRPLVDHGAMDGRYSCLYAHPDLVPLGGEEWGLCCRGVGQRHDTWGAGPYTGYAMGEYFWARWKPDRLAALEALSEGQFTTVERVCQGTELRLNYRTEIGGWIRAGLVERPSTPPRRTPELEGFELDACDPLEGDEVSRVVTWSGRHSLEALAGRSVSVRIRMARARLFSVAL